jgi:hypothetical protein
MPAMRRRERLSGIRAVTFSCRDPASRSQFGLQRSDQASKSCIHFQQVTGLHDLKPSIFEAAVNMLRELKLRPLQWSVS